MFERPVSKSISANTRAVLSALSIRSPFTQELTVTTGTHDAGGAASNTPNTCASAVSVPARMSSGAVASQMASTRITVTGPVARMRSGLPPNPANAPSGARRHDVHLSRCLAGEAPKRAAAVAALCIHEAIPSLPHAHGQALMSCLRIAWDISVMGYFLGSGNEDMQVRLYDRFFLRREKLAWIMSNLLPILKI